MDTALDRLEALAGRPDGEIDLLQGAMEISRLYRSDLDENGVRAGIATLGARARERVPAGADLAGRVQALSAFLFGEIGFRGNRNDFYDPRNSFIDQVIDRRVGIPITLSLVYTEVARRAGVPAWGVGFPGHFLVKVGRGEDALLLDAFADGALLSTEDLDARLASLYGEDGLRVAANPSLLRAASSREVLVRMLRNLKSIYLRRGDSERALTAVSAILTLAPDLAEELRDRGLLYRELGYRSAALDDLRRFSHLADDASEIAAVTSVIDELAAAPMRLH
jgi:regulator of sirC expression with transglutaminase-like and TPR domain